MSDNYLYEKTIKANGKKKKMFMAGLALGCFTVFAAIELLSLTYIKYPSLMLIGVIFPVILFLVLRRYISSEIEISVSGGRFIMCVIYGGSKRKIKFNTSLSEFAYIAPHSEEHISKALEFNIITVFYAVSEEKKTDPAENVFIAVFDLPKKRKADRKDRSIDRGLLIFESDEKLNKILKTMNYQNFIKK